MTDYEIIKEMLTRREVEFQEPDYASDYMCIELEAGSNNVTGYTGFYATFYFENDGTLIKIGAWE